MQKNEKIIGILGGMGPEATIDLFQKIVKLTPAQQDQEHLRIIIDNNPKIPDRTKAILHGGENPLPELIKTAQNLERAGADFIIIACNTAHYYLPEIQKTVNITIFSIMQETALYIHHVFPSMKQISCFMSPRRDGATTATTANNNQLFCEKVLSPYNPLSPKAIPSASRADCMRELA